MAMDWNAAIEKHREALKCILAALVAMAGLADGRKTLPRHLYRAVLRLLRPAEAAARRLIIVAARGLVVTLPPPRQRKPSPAPTVLRNGVGTGILMPRGVLLPPRPTPPLKGEGVAEASESPSPLRGGVGGGGKSAPPLGFQLLDPLRLPRPRRPIARGVPRISVPGFTVPFPVPPPPAPDDPIDATRLGRRLAALGSALDDLPAHARRFAGWRARVLQSRGLPNARPRRAWPLRPGRPPGWRRRPEHEVHDVLNAAHGLAFWALNRPDTS
jgi:hypothetical protein